MSLSDRIPNNVDLGSDPKLQRALEHWQPEFLSWWGEMGPEGFQNRDVYLRTAVGTESGQWARFGYVRMPEYRWGIFLSDAVPGRTIGFGDLYGEPVWQDVPGEHRNSLRRLIVTQADTEPASVEQQRLLGQTAPSLYDLRNLFQVNVEEGRHLWAMVYLLHRYFGRDGREEAEELLARRSGNADRPRVLDAFNAPVEDWLSFFFFTMLIDRDGKYQLLALAESGFDPLSRSARFMLAEEAHHLFVGETGIGRVVRRTAELMREGREDVRRLGGIDLPTLQKYLNHWFSAGLDLFGSEISTNAATAFGAGLKGRAYEDKREDHVLANGVTRLEVLDGDRVVAREVAARSALNEQLRDDYIADCQRALDRWNAILAQAGYSDSLALPSRRFNRRQGLFSAQRFAPDGTPISAAIWARHESDWLPTVADRAFVASLQQQAVTAPGQVAGWIAPPAKGIGGQQADFEYVRTEG